MAVAVVPREGDYLTNGTRLVRVLSVGTDDVQVEDAETDQWETLTRAVLGRMWRPVKKESDG